VRICRPRGAAARHLLRDRSRRRLFRQAAPGAYSPPCEARRVCPARAADASTALT